MSDPRLTPNPELVSQDTPRRINASVANLCRTPNGPRDRQLLYGDDVTVLGESGGHAYVRAARDGYIGYVDQGVLTSAAPATHYVHAPCSHAYVAADFKSADTCALSHLSRLHALSETAEYVEIAEGFVPKKHLAPIGQHETDPAQIAVHYLGTDYLWGGNSRWGIDCSGLVQAALRACDMPCPGDSDQQMTLGSPADENYLRNDLLFWKGHVALVVDSSTMIHANAHAMAVCYEPIKDAIARIAASNGGPVTAHRRL